MKPMKAIARRTALSSFAKGALLFAFTTTTGCGSAWWQNIISNPGSVQQLISYVTSFLQAVAAIWNVIFPLIPTAAQAQAETDYNNAIFSVEQGVVALEDALKAAAAAQQSNPDFSALIANVQAAVDALMKIVAQWQSGTAGAGGASPQAAARTTAASTEMAELVRQQGVIHNWK